MTVKPFISFVTLIFTLPFTLVVPAIADTNAAGDEIIILGDTPIDRSYSNSPNFSPKLQSDPVLNYLPDSTALEQPNTDRPITADDDLRQRIINGYAMPEVDSAYTANHESWYASRPDYVKRMVQRSQKYLFHIVEEVEKRGMPTEIALLPMVESAFNPQAYSRSRASGMWQFIPSTGKDFGLKQNWWVDNRRDVTAATNAALNYLEKLHVMFGTWDLALAAYNAGEGTVRRAIQRNEKSGLPTDYESLNLPAETRNYVPKLQAVKNIMTNPERYGLSIQTIPNRPYFTKVVAPEQIDIKLAAQLAEISFEEFSSLNPEYNRPVLTSSGKVHEILLPVSAANTFAMNLANYDKPLVSWQTYHAKRGERMDNIARKFGIGLAQLRDVNDLPSRNKMGMARPLLVPNSSGSTDIIAINTNDPVLENDKSFDDAKGGSSGLMHTVKNKETLATIAKQYGVSQKNLIAANHLKSFKLKPGQKLTITSADTRLAMQDTKPKLKLASSKVSIKKPRYTVKRGDTLDSIARKFDVARDDLQRWNKITGSHIIPGNKLTVQRPDEA
ncbi:MAG TPA: LysM peptidoglycan-binding domain-containing protein [Methylophilaceae bacterium]|nr:LysM peptidoglycan-binding domain-containing protein [Methylophilaceae bacterium]